MTPSQVNTNEIKVCPLCNNTSSSLIHSISFEKIWLGLSRNHGAVFSQEVIDKHSPALFTNLIECNTCGIQYFKPSIAGDEKFYSQLTSTAQAYYNDDKWDFQMASTLVMSGDLILDIACGSGSWLKLAKAKGANVSGIDTNPSAVAAACSEGLSVHCMSIEEFAPAYQGFFDIVTAFQVFEHINNIIPFVESAITCLKPGGRLIVTVPNRQRNIRSTFEPLDHPPHHISRWSCTQLHYLAKLSGLKLVETYYQHATMYECRQWFRKKFAPYGYSESLLSRMVGRLVFSPSMYSIYRHIGLLDLFRLYSLSILGVFEKE